MAYLWATLLLLAVFAGWILTVLSLPGNWLMVIAVALYAWLVPEEVGGRLAIGWTVVLWMFGLAVLSEVLEFAAGALGASSGGGSKRSAILATVGAVPGAILGAAVGVPIPVIGPVVAIVVFAGLGALAGAMLGEQWKGRSLEESWKVGKGAFWGRILGTVAKVAIASVLVVLAVAGLALR